MTYDYDKIYVDNVVFPFTPVHDAGQNDVDLDPYTNTLGYTKRNRIRHDVKTLDFSIPVMSGAELHKWLILRSPVWFNCTFFDESEWKIVTKKMYCSSPKYTKYYLDKDNPELNIYTDVTFGFVEE